MTAPTSIVRLLLILSFLPAAVGLGLDDLDEAAVEALVAEYFDVDARTTEGLRRQNAILNELEPLNALDAKQAKKWRKQLVKLFEDGPELKKKKGRKYFFEEEKRGLFIVGGKIKKPKGLFIGMHGGGVGSGDAGNSHGAFNSAISKLGFVAIFPEVLEKTEHGWTDSGTEEFVLELVDRALRTWSIDRNKVFFGGHSMGGYGTWTLGGHHADRVAGLAASAGAPTPVRSRQNEEIIDVSPGVIPNLRNVRMVSYQSADDPQVPPDVNRAAVKLVDEARERWGGYDFEYWEVERNGHSLPPGGAKALLAKVAKHERRPRPEKIIWQPTLAWKRHFYWLWCKSPQLDGIVEAELDREANSVSVTSDRPLAGYYVLLDSELLDTEREVTVTANGDVVFQGVPERSLAALLASGVRGDPELTFDVRIPLVK